jgi:hypothetical protein
MERHLNVLVTESEWGAAGEARASLSRAGHNVLQCHEHAASAFPCKALVPGQQCPLEATEIDVALAVRARPRSQPAPQEDGVTCALRRHIPLVVAGSAVLDPFEEYAADVVERDGDIVGACVRAAHAPLPKHTEAAARTLRAALDRRNISASPVVAVVRDAGTLRADVTGAEHLDRATRAMAAVRITAALREIDKTAKGIDVAFHDARGPS